MSRRRGISANARNVARQGDGFRKGSNHPTTFYADFRPAFATSVLPSDQIAPGTLWLEAMTESNAVSIQLQSCSVMVKGGNSLMVWLPWPETWVRILRSLNSGTVMSWQNRPLLAVSSTFHDALSRSDFGGPNSTPIISPLPRTSFKSS